jgi:hypothetical protein
MIFFFCEAATFFSRAKHARWGRSTYISIWSDSAVELGRDVGE